MGKQRMVGPAQADEAVLEGEEPPDMRRRAVEPAHGDLDVPGLDQPDRVVPVGGAQVDADLRRGLAQPLEQRNEDRQAEPVGRADDEMRLGDGRVEITGVRDHLLGVAQDARDNRSKIGGARRGAQPLGRADEKRVLEPVAQPLERVRHGRLGAAQTVPRPRDTALFHQDVEDRQQVHVEIVQHCHAFIIWVNEV
ncbi:hypothetical protein PVT71_26775 (plasmid) [Salipiger sp. H15]|uniref:Uncharacterized protein n=1 Tax=Alloyangia sp. H15 TaxID=3029062 RepID=A0AAU8AS77_9RHOB